MKSILSLLCIVALGLVLSSPLSARDQAPTPESWLEVNGQMLPVYSTKTLPPTRMKAPENPGGKSGVGEAFIYAIVETNGQPSDVAVKMSQPTPAYGEAAKAAVKDWRFQVLKTNGKAIRYIILAHVKFRRRSY